VKSRLRQFAGPLPVDTLVFRLPVSFVTVTACRPTTILSAHLIFRIYYLIFISHLVSLPASEVATVSRTNASALRRKGEITATQRRVGRGSLACQLPHTKCPFQEV